MNAYDRFQEPRILSHCDVDREDAVASDLQGLKTLEGKLQGVFDALEKESHEKVMYSAAASEAVDYALAYIGDALECIHQTIFKLESKND